MQNATFAHNSVPSFTTKLKPKSFSKRKINKILQNILTIPFHFSISSKNQSNLKLSPIDSSNPAQTKSPSELGTLFKPAKILFHHSPSHSENKPKITRNTPTSPNESSEKLLFQGGKHIATRVDRRIRGSPTAFTKFVLHRRRGGTLVNHRAPRIPRLSHRKHRLEAPAKRQTYSA